MVLWPLITPVIPTRPIGTPSITIHQLSFTNRESVTKAWIIFPSRRTPRSPLIQLQFPPAPSPCSTCPRRALVKPSRRWRSRKTSADVLKVLISTYIRERVPPPGQRLILLTIRDLFLWRFQRGPGARSQLVFQKPPIERPETPEIASPACDLSLNGGPFVIIFRLRTIMPQPCAGVCLRVIEGGLSCFSHIGSLLLRQHCC